MKTQFLPLLTLGISHPYYGDGICPDFDFMLAEHSRLALDGARLLIRRDAGQLYVLFEADEKNHPMQDIAGLELLIGLRLRNPCFEYFTDALPEPLPIYSNTTTTLNAPQSGDLVARSFTPVAAMTQRPLNLSLHRTRDDALMWGGEIRDGENMPAINLSHWEAGCYRLTQQSVAGSRSRDLMLAPDLFQAGIWGAIKILVSAEFWNSPAPPDFQIKFGARQETLNYYVVAPSGWSDFDKLSVSANSLTFEKIVPVDFPQDGITPAQLGLPTAQAVLFRSQMPVPRSAAAALNIQLKRNEDTLVKNLPLPSADMPSARFVVHLSKP